MSVGGDAVAELQRSSAGAWGLAVRKSEHHKPVVVRRGALRPVADVAVAAVRVRGRGDKRARARAGRRELPERGVLHARVAGLRERRGVGRPPGQRVVRVGGEKSGVYAAGEGVAVGRQRWASRSWDHAVQWVHVRPHVRH